MFDPRSFVNPTPLAHADISRDVLPRGGTSQRISWSGISLIISNFLGHKDHGRVVRRFKVGQSVATVAATMDASKSVISRLKMAAEGGNALRNHVRDSERNTTPLEDHYVVFVAKKGTKIQSWPDSCKPLQPLLIHMFQQEPYHSD
ncbi:hypothetical protein TNCV_959671 [Trichonephila clavipes]|nr:hypothetical protein TNCV_959671 [Trichonephila clavipes]